MGKNKNIFCQSLVTVLTLLEDSQSFGYKASTHTVVSQKGIDTDRWLFFLLLYFCFVTSISVVLFQHFSIFHLSHQSCGGQSQMSDIYDIWLCPLHDRWHKFHVHGTNRIFHFLPSDKEYPPPSLVNM